MLLPVVALFTQMNILVFKYPEKHWNVTPDILIPQIIFKYLQALHRTLTMNILALRILLSFLLLVLSVAIFNLIPPRPPPPPPITVGEIVPGSSPASNNNQNISQLIVGFHGY